MVNIHLCKNCIHNPVCTYNYNYNLKCEEAINTLDNGIIILDIKCFFYQEAHKNI